VRRKGKGRRDGKTERGKGGKGRRVEGPRVSLFFLE